MRGLVLLGLVAAVVFVPAGRADDPPKKLTPEDRKELEAKRKELTTAAAKALQVRKFDEAQKAIEQALEIARRLHPDQDHPDVATTMNNVAFVLNAVGKPDDAEAMHRETLAMRKRLSKDQDHPDVAASLNNLAIVLYEHGKAADAEPLYRDALAMRKRLYKDQDHPDVVISLNNLAVALRVQGKAADAEPFAREALTMRKRLYKDQDHPDVVISLNNLAIALQAQGKAADAEPFAREALAMNKRLHKDQDHPDVATTMNSLAVVLYDRGKAADAEVLYRDALAMRKKFYKGDSVAVATTMNGLAAALRVQGKAADAEPFAREALTMRKRLYKDQDRIEVAQSLNILASVLFDRGKAADAEPLYRDALAMRKRLNQNQDDPDVATTLNDLASALENLGKAADAESLHRDALAMRKRLYKDQDHPHVTQSLHNLAFALASIGRSGEAEPFARDALAMNKRLSKDQDHPDVAVNLNNLAFILRLQGRPTDAETAAQAALAMNKRLHKDQDHMAVAGSMQSLAGVLMARGKPGDAEPLYREALALIKRIHKQTDHPAVAICLGNLAVAMDLRGKPADAEPLHREALAMNKRLYKNLDHPEVAASLNGLGHTLYDLGKASEAEPFLRDALDMNRRLYPRQDNAAVSRSLNSLGILLYKMGRPREAEPLLRDALAVYRSLVITTAIASDPGVALNLYESLPLTRDAFLSNARLNRSDPVDVYAAVWASKAFLTRVSERQALAARTAVADPKVSAALADLADTRRRRADLILAPVATEPGAKVKRDEEIAAYDERIRKLTAALPAIPAVARADKLAKATPDDLRAAFPAGTVVIDFLGYSALGQKPNILGKAGETLTPSYAAFVLTKDAIKWIDLGPADPIETVVAQWREAITAIPRFPVPADLPRKARELIWDKVRKELPAGTTTVYVSPDAALTGVPWVALPGDKPGTILLEDVALAVVPHAPFLLDGLWPGDPVPNRPDRLLAVGGVAYGDRPVAPSGLWVAVVSSARHRGNPAVGPDQKLNWSDLPKAAGEADEIVRRAAGRKLATTRLTAAEASTDRVLAELPKARFAHFATHGFFADPKFLSVLNVDPRLFEMRGGERVGDGVRNPLVMTGLVFAGANRPDTPGRGILTGEALIDRNLSGLELAVLSACETGLGDVSGGEGVFGLQRAFHVAGARNVVASLWKVDDAATAALMGEFYRRLWADAPVPPIEALRQAQLAVYRAAPKDFPAMARRGPPVAGGKDLDTVPAPKPGAGAGNHPALWAAFTLSGPGTGSTPDK